MHRRDLLSYLIISASVLLVYYNTLTCDFTFDDNSAVVHNRYIRTNETDWLSVFGVDYWGTPIQSERSHKSYRPITLLTFRLNYLISGLSPYGFHLGNVLLHLLVSLQCYKFMLNILKNDVWTSLIFALFFALHPLKSEAVSGIVGRAELLSTFFTFVSLFFYFDSSFYSFTFSIILATFSKEQGLTIPCVCIVMELCRMYFFYQTIKPYSLQQIAAKLTLHSSFLRIMYLGFFTLILAASRIYLMGGTLPVFTKFDNPASFEDTPIRQLTYNYLLPLNAKLFLYPLELCADWTMNSIPLVRDFYDIRNVWTVVFYIVTFMLLISSVQHLRATKSDFKISYSRKIGPILALSLTSIPFIPASNLFFPVGFVIAERILYMPSIGYSLILAIGFKRLQSRFKSQFVRLIINLSALALCAILALRTFNRNLDWKNDLTLFQSGLKVNSNNAKLYNNIGHFYERNRQYNEAIKFFKLAASKDSEDIGSDLNIARTLIHLDQIDEAEDLLWSIKPKVRQSAIKNRIIPHYLNVWINLASVISMNDSRLLEAEKLYREVISIRRDFIDAYINLGEIFIRQAQFDKAISVYEQALRHTDLKNDIKLADVYYNIGIALARKLNNSKNSNVMQLKKDDLSKTFNLISQNFVRAIQINSEHKEALTNLAILVQKPEFPEQNQTYYRHFVLDALKAYTKDEEQERIQFQIAMTLIDIGGPNNRVQALEHLKRAVEIKPDFRSALYNSALLYYRFEDYNTSLTYLNQLNTYHPNYTKAKLLSGDVCAKLGKMDLSEKFYRQVLLVEKNNYEALQKLCFILKKGNRLQEMKKCLSLLLND